MSDSIQYDEYAEDRSRLISCVLKFLSELIASNGESLFIYVVGSAARQHPPNAKDLDIMLVDSLSTNSPNEANIMRLRQCLEKGNPLDGAFDSTNPTLRGLIKDGISSHSLNVKRLDVSITFAFGPAKSEFNIPDNGLHFHICGPLTKGDSVILGKTFPFHVLEFLTNHQPILGPALSDYWVTPAPSNHDLCEWDLIMANRLVGTSNNRIKRKWLARIIANRKFIRGKDYLDSTTLDRCKAALDSEKYDTLDHLALETIRLAKDFQRSDS